MEQESVLTPPPVVVYICSSDNLVESSLCILPEDLNHDVAFVIRL